MRAHICTICGFLYDDESAEHNPEGGLIPFEELDLDWVCPGCGAKGHLFEETNSTRTHDVVDENSEKK